MAFIVELFFINLLFNEKSNLIAYRRCDWRL